MFLPWGEPILLYLCRYRPIAVVKLPLHGLILTAKAKSVRDIPGLISMPRQPLRFPAHHHSIPFGGLFKIIVPCFS